MKHILLALALALGTARAVTIDAVYFGQTHVLKATDAYFGLVGEREALIKVHVTDPAAPASPAVSATLSLGGQTLVLPLTGPANLPTSIPDGLGVVQHSYANTFTAIMPAAWVKAGLQVTVNAGSATTTITNMKVGAPTKVIMTMFDVQYFADTTDTYPSGTFTELEAKWPVSDLILRRLGHVVFPELVIPPRQDVGSKAVRIKSKAEYFAQTNLSFDGEQSAALEWNAALKRAAGQSGRWSLFYLNVYNAFAGGQAGGFAGVGSGTSVGILHHELGHALSLPHWGDNAAYPYKGDMHGIQAPTNYNETHAGPAWAFHLPTRAFIPPTTQTGNAGGKPVGTYKADPMQGGGTGWQEPAYLMNHFSDYSVNQMRSYLQGHVVVWNAALNSWAQWNSTTGDYTTTVSNNGVQFPTTRDVSVISIMASVSGANPGINMVYPPIGPYTSGLIQLFDPTVAADRTAAQTKFAPSSGCDYCVRVVQGGVTKTYMLAASNLSTADPYAESSLLTEAINLPAADGAVTKIELLSTPNAEDVGLPATPTVLYTWAPLMPEPGAWDLPPTANSSSAITMTAPLGEVAFGFTGGTVEYQFIETTGNPGATDSAWQTNRSYTDTGLTAGTQYSYTVAIRAGSLATSASAPASATTPSVSVAGDITVDDTQTFALQSGSGYKSVTGIGTFNPGGSDKLVVVVAGENANNDHFAFRGVTYNGVQMTEVVQQTAGTADGAVAIYYLDNPGAIAGGINVSGYNPNGGMGTAYALSGTRPGFGAFNSKKGGFVTGAPITTSANKSLVIAALENSNGGTPTANAPLTQTNSGSWGSNWGSHASGYVQVATPAAAASAFTTPTSSAHSINIASVEFLAQTTPGSTWVQTVGGAQSWTTGANWITGTAPTPLAGDTVDFSTADIAANTTVTLGADRTGALWKFGDTAGAETWTVNAGNTITLAGTTPTIEVVNNSAQINAVVAGTAGLSKTGAGTLHLNAINTYGGVTRINAGTLQATTLANGGSNSSIGSASTASTNLILNGGTLEYVGAGGGTNRLFSLQTSSTLDSSGTGAVSFTNASAIGFNSGTAAKTLTLDGTNTGANNITPIIGDNTGATSLTKSGAGTWMLSAANTYTGTTTINGGTLRLANVAAVQDSSQVNINNGTNAGTLQLSTNTAFAAFPTIGAGSSAQATILADRASAGAGLTHVLGAANMGVNTYNFAAGTNVTSGTAGITFSSVGLSGGANGTTVLNPTTANLTIVGGVTIPSGGTTKTLNLGGTSAAGSIGGAIDDGIGTLSLTKSNTSTWTLSGLSATAASNYGGSTIIDDGTLRITTTSPSLTGGLTFGSASGSTNFGTFDLSAASATFGGALLVRTDSATPNAITIGSSRTLQIGGSVTIGYNSAANSTTELSVSGAGTFSIGSIGTPTNANVQIGNGQTTNISNTATLDLSGIATFFSNLGTGTFRVGNPTNGGGQSAGGSTVILSPNSTLIAEKLLLASPDTASVTQSLKLGSGANVLNVNTVHITGTGDLFANTNGRSTGNLSFNGATGSLTLRGLAGGTSRSDLNVAWTNMNTGNAPTGTFNTTGHTADLRLGTLTIGRRTNTGTIAAGVFNFSQGQLDANDLIVALAEAGSGSAGTVSLSGGTSIFNTTTNPIRLGENTTAAGTATGTLNISGSAIVNVAASAGNSIRLGHATTAGGTATGNLNITGGTLTVAGDIIRGTATGTSNATVKLSGGTLNMGGHDIGDVTFTVESGTLQNVASINGTGGLTKTTTGTLTISGTNTYAGTTAISAGTLALGASNVLPGTVAIGSATLNAATFTDTLGTLDVTAAATVNLGSGAALSFADSSAVDWSGGTLTITGTFVSGSSLRFGTTASGLTPAQLAVISAPGAPFLTLNSSGYLVASSGANFTNWQAANGTTGGFNADHDNDGVLNGIEYFLGGNTNTTGPTPLPTIINTSGTLRITWTKSANYLGTYGTNFSVETTDTLGGTWTTETLGGTVVIVGNTITYTFPASVRRFARLKVTGP